MKIKMNLVVFAVFGLIIASLVGVSGYYYMQYKNTKALLSDPSKMANEEVKKIVDKVGMFMALPTDEEATLATVLDVEKLKEQPFFAKAAVGDKVIIYTKAGKAILYRPSTNKIIEAMPLSFNPSAGGSPTPKPTKTPEE